MFARRIKCKKGVDVVLSELEAGLAGEADNMPATKVDDSYKLKGSEMQEGDIYKFPDHDIAVRKLPNNTIDIFEVKRQSGEKGAKKEHGARVKWGVRKVLTPWKRQSST